MEDTHPYSPCGIVLLLPMNLDGWVCLLARRPMMTFIAADALKPCVSVGRVSVNRLHVLDVGLYLLLAVQALHHLDSLTNIVFVFAWREEGRPAFILGHVCIILALLFWLTRAVHVSAVLVDDFAAEYFGPFPVAS